MSIYSIWPIPAILEAAYSAVLALAQLLTPLTGTLSAAAALMVLALLVRSVLIPVGVSQTRAQRDRARIAPQLAALKALHGTNVEKLQRATMELYRDEKTSPLAGCLPMLVQAPVVSIVYGLFILPEINGHPNALLDFEFAGVTLGTSVVHLIGSGGFTGQHALVFGGLIALLLGLGQLSRMAQHSIMRRVTGITDAAKARVRATGGKKVLAALDAAPSEQEQMMLRMQKPLSFLPFLTAVFAVFVPLAAVLYLVVTTTWSVTERFLLARVILGRAQLAAEADDAPVTDAGPRPDEPGAASPAPA